VNEQTRAYLYRISLAVMLVLVGYNAVTAEQAAMWQQVIIAVLGIGSAGLATKNTSRRRTP